jgi:hypothetical protein
MSKMGWKVLMQKMPVPKLGTTTPMSMFVARLADCNVSSDLARQNRTVESPPQLSK